MSFETQMQVFPTLKLGNWVCLRQRKANTILRQDTRDCIRVALTDETLKLCTKWFYYIVRAMNEILSRVSWDDIVPATASHLAERKWAGVIYWGQTDTGNPLLLCSETTCYPGAICSIVVYYAMNKGWGLISEDRNGVGIS